MDLIFLDEANLQKFEKIYSEFKKKSATHKKMSLNTVESQILTINKDKLQSVLDSKVKKALPNALDHIYDSTFLNESMST